MTFCENRMSPKSPSIQSLNVAERAKKVAETAVTASVDCKLMPGYKQVSTKIGKPCNMAE